SMGGQARTPDEGGSRRLRMAGFAAVLAIAFFIPVVTPLRSELVTRFHQITDIQAPSTRSRVYLWRAGLEMAEDHPLLGVGTDGSTGALAAALAGWAAGASCRDGASAVGRDPPRVNRRSTRYVAWTIAALLGALFVLLPWLAETTATPALRDPMTPAERADRL